MSRRSYRARCRFYLCDTRKTYIEFRDAEPGAAYLWGLTPFHPDRDKYDSPPLGPVECGELDAPRWSYLPPGPARPWTGGQVPDGTAAEFLGLALVPVEVLDDGTLPWALLPSCVHPPCLALGGFSTDGSSFAGVALGAFSIGGSSFAALALAGYSWSPAADQLGGGIALSASSDAAGFLVGGGLAFGAMSLDLDAPALCLGGYSVGPMELVTVTNGSGASLSPGQVVAFTSGGPAVLAGAAAALALAAGGVVVSPSTPGNPVTLQTGSLLTLPDWTAGTGSAALTPGATYYLSATPGLLTTSPPLASGSLLQPIGVAVTTQTLHLCLCVPTARPTPMSGTAEVKQAGGVQAGRPVTLHTSGNGWVYAKASDNAHQAVGLALAAAAFGHGVDVQTSGLFYLDDWTNVVGGVDLTPNAWYYLDTAEGKLTLTAPDGAGVIAQQVGRALTAKALDILISPPILLSGNYEST